MELLIDSPEKLPDFIPQVLAALNGRRKIALYGDMGAGKTTFVKAFCAFLGVHDDTASPTFSLINEYAYTDAEGAPALVHHLDLYRLRSPQEVYDIGIEDVLDDPWYCFIEWPQVAEAFFPSDMAKIQIEILGESARRVLIL